MGIDYDAWLEQPYQDMCEAEERWEEAEEAYRGSDQYNEDYEEWLLDEGNENKSKKDYDGSTRYEQAVESYMERLAEEENSPWWREH